MRTNTSWRPRKKSAVAILLAALVGLVAMIASSASATSHGNVTLRVDLFGDFGYHDLYKQFEKAHPGVTIKEDIEDYATHHSNLAKHLATGAGADDVEAIEVGFIAQFKSEPQYFVDLNSLGASSLKSLYLPWKWQQSLAPNGAQIGLGTDVGSMGICYRRDLLQAAGLPTSREAVSKLWPTWQKFIDTGVQFEKKAPKGTYFFDSGSNVFNAMIGQLNPAYYDAQGNVIVDKNSQVQQAWNLTMQGVQKGESAGLPAFSTQWNTGFKQSSFATVTCPAWMMGYIQGQAPNSAGDWDIATVPGGGGSWGGSFLAIPKQSKNQQLAYELVKFLTSPASQAYVFKQTGNLPSEPQLYSTPAIANFKNPFFSNAPVGKIFTSSVKSLKPQITGPHQGDIQTAASNAIQRVEQKKQSPSQSWAQFLKDVANVAT